MKAARYYGIQDVRLEDVPEPNPGLGELQIAVSYNGICGTDLHEYFDGPRTVPLTPHPLTGVSAPVILGHEAIGIVSGVGKGVEGVKEGQLVAIEPTRFCHSCEQCAAGNHNLCDTLAFHGYATEGGGLAEFTVVPSESVYAIPSGVAELEAAVIEPMAVALHAVKRWPLAPGGRAAIFGGGPIGLGILLCLKAQGVDDVIVIEPAPDRRSVAAGFGAQVIDPLATNAVEQVRVLTKGRGADVSFETAGAPTTFHAAIGATAKGGAVVLLTSGRHEVIAPLGQLMANEITLRTSYAYNNEFPEVISMMQDGAFPVATWVQTAPLSDLLNSFELLRRGEAIKLLIDPRSK